MSGFSSDEARAALAAAGIAAEPVGALPAALDGFSPLAAPRPGTVVWSRASDPGWERLAGCLVLGPADLAQPPAGAGGLRVADPMQAFAAVADRFGREPAPAGVAASARLGAGVVLGDDVGVGEHAVLGAGATVGAGTRIGAGAVIAPGTRIGRGCHIQAGATIGQDGYGFIRDRAGRPRRFPYVGHVVLEDRVHVGAHTCIARGHIQDTVIREETLIDTLCHIAHNADIGPRAFLIAGCRIGGTARIGADAFVGMGALVLKDVPDGVTVMGRGAMPLPASDAGLPDRYRL